MRKQIPKIIHFFFFVMPLLYFTACKTPRVYKTSVTTEDRYHSRYDDTTLAIDNSSILLPYNRFIDPAGTVIRFGDPALEIIVLIVYYYLAVKCWQLKTDMDLHL